MTVVTCPCGFEVRAGPGDEGPITQMLRHREEAHCPCGKAYVRVDSWLFCRRCDVFVRAA